MLAQWEGIGWKAIRQALGGAPSRICSAPCQASLGCMQSAMSPLWPLDEDCCLFDPESEEEDKDL